MKRIIWILALTLMISSCKTTKESPGESTATNQSITTEKPTTYANTITASELKEMLYIYASDEFEGRNTGDSGEQKALQYLTNFYTDQNITSAIEPGNYKQSVKFNQLFVPEISVEINGEKFKAFDDMIARSYSFSGELSATEIVYIGYGIDEPNYSDYKDIDTDGKIIVAKAGEPKNEDGTYKVSGTSVASKWSNGRQGRRSKSDAAKAHGAKAFFIVDNGGFGYYSNIHRRYSYSNRSLGLSLNNDEDTMFHFLINEAMGTKLVQNMDTSDEPKLIPTNVNITQKSKSQPLTGSSNIVAYVKGNEKPDEYIVISAHLDHVGIADDGDVYNGADDDGSGTVAILEIAEAFKEAEKNGHGPKRSVVFLHVTGEEKGLLGSQYYTDIEPIFPLSQTVANLNIDMIGRSDPKRTEGNRNYVYLIGSDRLSTELHELSEHVNEKYTNIELDYSYNDENDPNRFYFRSDHYNFAKNNVPIIFYFNGSHADYHKPSDTADKIEYDLLENRTKLVFYTAWELANRPQRIKIDKSKQAIGSN